MSFQSSDERDVLMIKPCLIPILNTSTHMVIDNQNQNKESDLNTKYSCV